MNKLLTRPNKIDETIEEKSLLKNTSWNLIGLAVPSIFAIPALAFLARTLGVEKFGLFMLAFSLVGYAGIFDGGLTRAVIRAVAMQDGDKSKDRTTIGTASWTVLVLSCFISPFVYIFSENLVIFLNVSAASSEDAKNAFKLLAFVIPPFLLSLIWFAYPEGRQDFITLNAYKVLSGILIAILPALTILYEANLTSAIKGLLIARIISLLISYVPCYKDLGTNFFDFKFRILKELFKFGGWITFSNVISPIMVYADRFILSNIMGAQVVAFYTAPSEVIARMSIVPGAASRTIFPLFSKLQNDSKSAANKAYVGLLIVSISMAILVIFFANMILSIWLGDIYSENSSNIIRILAIGFVFNSIAQIPFSKIQAFGNARLTAMIHLFEVGPYIILLAVMVHFYGLTGAAIAWSIRTAIDYLLLEYYAKKC